MFCNAFSLVACNGGGEDVGGTPDENGGVTDNTDDGNGNNEGDNKDNVTPEPTPEELAKAENIEYLKTVTYLDFELTDSAEPYFMGRWFEKEIEGENHMVTVTDGSALYFLINNASSFDVNFTVITTMEEPYFAYSIDGGEPVRQHITEPTVTLPDTSRHTVRIIADGMTEGEGKWKDEKGFALKSITVADGGEIFGIKPTNKVIFYYGDSITEGIRALNMNATSDGNSATNSYAWYCSEELGAVTYSIGYGASGVTVEGSFTTMIKAIDYNSEGREVNDGITPDLIVVNHGTNDGGTSSRIFKGKLTAAIERLQEKYEGVTIVYLIPFRQTHADDIKSVMSEFENVHVVETADWDISFTDNGYHPDVAGAKKAGGKLAEALLGIMGEEFFN
jgi:lysophospholipase L1-like esterase